MPTSNTRSSLSGAILESLLDEVEKIAEENVKKDPRWKRIAKAGAGYAVGAALGHGAGMLIEKAVTHAMKHRYPTWSKEKKLRYLGPLLGAATVVGIMANRYGQELHAKAHERDRP